MQTTSHQHVTPRTSQHHLEKPRKNSPGYVKQPCMSSRSLFETAQEIPKQKTHHRHNIHTHTHGTNKQTLSPRPSPGFGRTSLGCLLSKWALEGDDLVTYLQLWLTNRPSISCWAQESIHKMLTESDNRVITTIYRRSKYQKYPKNGSIKLKKNQQQRIYN